MEVMATILGKGSHPNTPGMISCGREYISSVNRKMPAKASRCLPRESLRETAMGLALSLATAEGLAALTRARLLFSALRLNNTPGPGGILADLALKTFIRCRSLTFSRSRYSEARPPARKNFPQVTQTGFFLFAHRAHSRRRNQIDQAEDGGAYRECNQSVRMPERESGRQGAHRRRRRRRRDPQQRRETPQIAPRHSQLAFDHGQRDAGVERLNRDHGHGHPDHSARAQAGVERYQRHRDERQIQLQPEKFEPIKKAQDVQVDGDPEQ